MIFRELEHDLMYDDSTPFDPFEGIDLTQFNLTGDSVTGTTKTADFLAFDHLNPGFTPLLVRMAEEYIETTGKQQCGMRMLIETARWKVDIAVARVGVFEIDNDHCTFYARKIMAENPSLRRFFKLRKADEADDWMISTYGWDTAVAVRPVIAERYGRAA